MVVADCYSKKEAEPCEQQNGTWVLRTCYNDTYVDSFNEWREVCNATGCYDTLRNDMRAQLRTEEEKHVSSSEQYFK